MIDYHLRNQEGIERNFSVFEEPSLCSRNPGIYKINWNGEDVFFGIINDKLAVFSTYFEDEKIKMKLYGVKKINPEENLNGEYLKGKANLALTNLIKLSQRSHNNKKTYHSLEFYSNIA
jgi:hypothetical protein